MAAKQLNPAVTAPDLSDLARVANVDRSHLVPVRSVVSERGEQWVVSELADGLPLRDLLKRARPATICAVAIAMDLLDGLAELHRAGLWHGAVHDGNVHVGADGTVRLSDYGLSVRGSANEASLRVADVSGVGVLLCSLLRITPEAQTAPGAGRKPSQRAVAMAASLLGLEARRMVRVGRSRRAAGYEAVQARLALWEAAGPLANRRVHAQAKRRLAEMVAAEPLPRSSPSGPSSLRPSRRVGQPAAAGRARSGLATAEAMPVTAIEGAAPRRDGTPVRLILALALIAGIAVAALALTSPPPGAVSPSVAVRSSATAPAAISPPGRPDGTAEEGAGVVASPAPAPVGPAPAIAPVAAVAPPSAGLVNRVVGQLVQCDGAGCGIHVEVWVSPSAQARQVAWEIRSIDLCGGQSVVVGGGAVLAQPGWNHVSSDSRVPLTGPGALVVISAQPDRAASPILVVGSPGSC